MEKRLDTNPAPGTILHFERDIFHLLPETVPSIEPRQACATKSLSSFFNLRLGGRA
jgi:hypothetical protein